MEKQENILFRAIIAGITSTREQDTGSSDENSMDELEALIQTAGGEVVARVIQSRPSPDAHTHVGEGKAREIANLAEMLTADMVVFDSELSPSQVRALEEVIQRSITDRSGIILQIFAGRAHTAEGKLQVELAQYKYLLPRLTGRGAEMSRQGAGVLARGPGETKLETDRRHIRARIAKLKDELERVRGNRAQQRRRREKNGIPLAALVGYTNAGKSTLLNALTGAGIEANDRLFDTLDTTTRHMRINDTQEILLSDTVGFIRRLPHHLVDAFRATLEELAYADIIVHVIDGSNPCWREQAEVTEKLTDEIAGAAIPRIRVLNKSDCCSSEDQTAVNGAIRVSAKTGEGLSELLAAISEVLDTQRRHVTLQLPYERASLLTLLHDRAHVVSAVYQEEYIMVEAVCTPKIFAAVREYLV